MKLVKVDWYGGKRRDGQINDFGYASDHEGKSYRIQEKMLTDWLKESLPREDQFVVLSFHEKTKKLQQVQAFSEVEQALYEELLEPITNQVFLTKAWHALNMDSYEFNQLAALSKATKNPLLHARVLARMWEHLSAEDKKESILRLELPTLPAYMLKDILNNEVSYDAGIEPILLATLQEKGTKSSVPYDVLNLYPSIQEHVYMLQRDVVKGLEDARFVAGIVEELGCTRPNVYVPRPNPLPGRDFTIEGVPIDYWFSIPALHEKARKSFYYESYLQFYAQYEAQTGEFGESPARLSAYLKEEKKSSVTWSYFPKEILLHPLVQPLVPASELFWIYNAGTDDAHAFISVIERLTDEERLMCLPELAERFKQDERFEQFLSPIDRAKQLYKRLPHAFHEVFAAQEPLVKNYLIYEMTKNYEQRPLPWLTAEKIAAAGNAEQHPMITALLYLLHRGITKTYHSEERIFKLIECEIQRQINEDLPIDTLALLPSCPFSVGNKQMYCEAKKITYYNEGQDDNEIIYCPKTRSSCSQIIQAYEIKEGAHLGARNELPTEYWTVQEMFAFAGMEPFKDDFFEKKATGHAQTYYVNKIAGWVNRILTVRERLRCSKEDCGKAFKVEYDFSKRFEVAYNATHFTCVDVQVTAGHDEHIYLSHCRCCKKLIDSRESRFKISATEMGWYMCIHCGSAEERKQYDAPWKKTPYYEQGDICPNCNYREEPMTRQVGASKWHRCKKCQHKIKTTV